MKRRSGTLSRRNITCAFCKSSDKNVSYGEFRHLGDITVHLFCLFLSHDLLQKAGESHGIDGFLKKDILAEINRGAECVCSYCQRPGATVNCLKAKCQVQFHLPCGLQNGSTHIFKNDFPSYCKSHQPDLQVIPAGILRDKQAICLACHCDISMQKERRDIIWMQCCGKNSFMHRTCSQHYADHAGYELKCPNCCDKMTFCQVLEMNGVFVHERDASWETEENAFSELVSCPEICSADTCLAEYRSYNRDNTLWELLSCWRCGALKKHRACANIPLLEHILTCDSCTTALQPKKTRLSISQHPCFAEICLCSRGRHHSSSSGDDRKIHCGKCTKFYVHVGCVKKLNGEWHCQLHKHFNQNKMSLKPT